MNAAALAAAAVVAASSGLHVTLRAPTHTPRIGTKWAYSVRATVGGRAVGGRITVQIVDPLGGVHPVDYRNTKRPIVRFPFKGTFRDFVIWPASSRGVPVTFRVTVTAAGKKKVVRYAVTPRG